jgi:hypothetical protein
VYLLQAQTDLLSQIKFSGNGATTMLAGFQLQLADQETAWRAYAKGKDCAVVSRRPGPDIASLGAHNPNSVLTSYASQIAGCNSLKVCRIFEGSALRILIGDLHVSPCFVGRDGRLSTE